MAGFSIQSLQKRLSGLREQCGPFTGTVFRSCTPRYATSSDLVSGQGSRLYGGRWNPTGVAALYASLTAETAMAEAMAHCRYYGFPAHAALPRTFVGVEVTLKSVLDLTDGDTRRKLSVSHRRMANADWRAETAAGTTPVTVAIGHAAVDAGVEGLLVPSAAEAGGKNLVVFVDNLVDESRVSVVSPEKL